MGRVDWLLSTSEFFAIATGSGHVCGGESVDG